MTCEGELERIMKWNIKPTPEPKAGLPVIGTFWRHAGSSIVYLRIDDAVGATALGHIEAQSREVFYSISDSGKITHTTRDRKNFGPLEHVPVTQIEGLT